MRSIMTKNTRARGVGRAGAVVSVLAAVGLAASAASAQGAVIVRSGDGDEAARGKVRRFVFESTENNGTGTHKEVQRVVLRSNGGEDGDRIIRFAADPSQPETPTPPPAPQPVSSERRVVLGVTLGEVGEALRQQLGLDKNDGVLVESVIGGLPAEDAGIERFDVIVRIDGQNISEAEDVRRVLSGVSGGDRLVIEAVRAGEVRSFVVELDDAPGDAGDEEEAVRSSFRVRVGDGEVEWGGRGDREDEDNNFRVFFSGSDAMNEGVRDRLEHAIERLRDSLSSLDKEALGETAYKASRGAIASAIESIGEQLERLGEGEDAERVILGGENAIRLRGNIDGRVRTLVETLREREGEMRERQEVIRERAERLSERLSRRAREMEARVLSEAGRGAGFADRAAAEVAERIDSVERRLGRIEGMLERVLDRLGGGGHE